MSLRLGDTAPNFTQKSTHGDIDFYSWAGDSWVVLFSHPADYTPVCTTELGRVAKLMPEFEKRGVKVLGLSVDDVDSHVGWVKDIEETQNAQVTYPIWQMPTARSPSSTACWIRPTSTKRGCP
jgi:alkyl hydroperoxide reductase subunit AhpC